MQTYAVFWIELGYIRHKCFDAHKAEDPCTNLQTLCPTFFVYEPGPDALMVLDYHSILLVYLILEVVHMLLACIT